MTPALFLAQRAAAMLLGVLATIHLGTVVYAVRGGLTAGDMLARTRGSLAFLALYVLFVLAISVHVPIGLRNILCEWTPWRGRSLDVAMAVVALLLLVLGLRAAVAVYA